MNAFQALWKKEWKMTRVYHLFIFIMIILIMGFTYWKLAKYGNEIMIIPIIIMISLHLFYLPGYMLFSLGGESKQLHMWLHTPQSIHKLIGVKLLTGLSYSVISLTLVTLIGYWIARGITGIEKYLSDLTEIMLWGEFHIIVGAIYISLLLLLLWTIRQMLKNYIGKLSWVVVIILFFALPILNGMFQTTAVYDAITHWGYITFDTASKFSSLNTLEQDYPNARVNFTKSFYFGTYFFQIILASIMYFLATYLLDKKVEV